MENKSKHATLFIGDLSIFCTVPELMEIFSPFGEVDSLEIKIDAQTQRSLNYGFVKFVQRDHAAEALKALKGYVVHGRAMRLGWAGMPNVKREPTEAVPSHQVHVGFSSPQIESILTEETLRKVFDCYGHVVDISIKQLKIDKDQFVQSGFGFVHFAATQEGIAAGVAAASALRRVVIDGVKYDCNLSHTFMRLLHGQHPYHNPVTPQGGAFAINQPVFVKPFDGRNLYVNPTAPSMQPHLTNGQQHHVVGRNSPPAAGQFMPHPIMIPQGMPPPAHVAMNRSPPGIAPMYAAASPLYGPAPAMMQQAPPMMPHLPPHGGMYANGSVPLPHPPSPPAYQYAKPPSPPLNRYDAGVYVDPAMYRSFSSDESIPTHFPTAVSSSSTELPPNYTPSPTGGAQYYSTAWVPHPPTHQFYY